MPKIPVRAARPTTQAREAYGLEVVFRKSVQVLRSAEADARRRVA